MQYSKSLLLQMACAIRLVVELENVDFTIGDNWITGKSQATLFPCLSGCILVLHHSAAAIHSFGGSIGDHATLYIMALEWSSQTVLGLGYGDFVRLYICSFAIIS